jgi:hypothetical protein
MMSLRITATWTQRLPARYPNSTLQARRNGASGVQVARSANPTNSTCRRKTAALLRGGSIYAS